LRGLFSSGSDKQIPTKPFPALLTESNVTGIVLVWLENTSFFPSQVLEGKNEKNSCPTAPFLKNIFLSGRYIAIQM